MKKFVLTLITLCFTMHAANDNAQPQQSAQRSPRVAHLLGLPAGILLAHLRAQYVEQHPQATLEQVDTHMRTVESAMPPQATAFLAQQMQPNRVHSQR